MTLLRDIIQKKGGDVYSVNPDATVLEALKLMADKNIGAVLILDEGRVEGILSERDCIRRVELHGRTVRDTQVKDIMTTKVLYVQAGQTLDFGTVLINEVPTFRSDAMPYGGVKDSGNTREGPAYAVKELTEERLVTLQG